MRHESQEPSEKSLSEKPAEKAAAKPARWEELGLAPEILQLAQAAGFTAPTEIQAQAVPIALEGRDLIASAKTGSGKTASFSLPLIHKLRDRRGTLALVLAPTREIALQTLETMKQFGEPLGVTAIALIGGTDVKADERAIGASPHVLVGTPGRICDHLERGNLWLEFVEHLVLDEADRMLDMGFAKEVSRIVAELPKTRQTMLFSATMPPTIEKLARDIMYRPERVAVGKALSVNTNISHEVYWVEETRKRRELIRFLEREPGTAIVFTRTKDECTYLWRAIHAAGIHESTYISSNKSQTHREEALEGFRNGRYRVLVATDVAGRGIHVENVACVVNYGVPEEPEDYIHRVGRTGRKDQAGRAITFASPEERRSVEKIEAQLREKLPQRYAPGMRADSDADRGTSRPKRAADRGRGGEERGARGAETSRGTRREARPERGARAERPERVEREEPLLHARPDHDRPARRETARDGQRPPGRGDRPERGGKAERPERPAREERESRSGSRGEPREERPSRDREEARPRGREDARPRRDERPARDAQPSRGDDRPRRDDRPVERPRGGGDVSRSDWDRAERPAFRGEPSDKPSRDSRPVYRDEPAAEPRRGREPRQEREGAPEARPERGAREGRGVGREVRPERGAPEGRGAERDARPERGAREGRGGSRDARPERGAREGRSGGRDARPAPRSSEREVLVDRPRRESRGEREGRYHREPRPESDARPERGSRETREPRDARPERGSREGRGERAAAEPRSERGRRDSREPRSERDARPAREARPPREAREPREPRSGRSGRSPEPERETRAPKEPTPSRRGRGREERPAAARDRERVAAEPRRGERERDRDAAPARGRDSARSRDAAPAERRPERGERGGRGRDRDTQRGSGERAPTVDREELRRAKNYRDEEPDGSEDAVPPREVFAGEPAPGQDPVLLEAETLRFLDEQEARHPGTWERDERATDREAAPPRSHHAAWESARAKAQRAAPTGRGGKGRSGGGRGGRSRK